MIKMEITGQQSQTCYFHFYPLTTNYLFFEVCVLTNFSFFSISKFKCQILKKIGFFEYQQGRAGTVRPIPDCTKMTTDNN